MSWMFGLRKLYGHPAQGILIYAVMQMMVCHEGAQEDEVLRAAMLHKR